MLKLTCVQRVQQFQEDKTKNLTFSDYFHLCTFIHVYTEINLKLKISVLLSLDTLDILDNTPKNRIKPYYFVSNLPFCPLDTLDTALDTAKKVLKRRPARRMKER